MNALNYKNGADFFHDTAANYGVYEALGICGRYIDTQMKQEIPNTEKVFRGELFAAMQEAAAAKTDPSKLVYPYDFQSADDRAETSAYHDSRRRNTDCAQAIDGAINASYYSTNHYHLKLAVMKTVNGFGFARVNAVLAYNCQRRPHDGRFSSGNQKWAPDYPLQNEAFTGAFLNSHSVLIDGFTTHARGLYKDLDADRFILPGHPVSWENVQGYEIIRAVSFEDRHGFAIGFNPDAVSRFVCWRFTAENSGRDYYWGRYCNDFTGAAENYTARVLVYMSGERSWETPDPMTPAKPKDNGRHNHKNRTGPER
ncbi:MAG: DUF3849 domain-containing protein [Syntrophomonadaceae bacterium]|jgi:hypothetical protein|nr:DUF3849 domain-containing protein [Syntrophomonadaceae bacterium]